MKTMADFAEMNERGIKNTSPDAEGIGIYVHIPFCVRKCLYCDFPSGPAERGQIRAYMDALVREIRMCGEEGARADTVFIGGGTPSIVEVSLMEKVFDELYRIFKVSPEAEITMEANPGTLSEEKLIEYRKLGVNRLSIGLQSADDRILRRLGRIHTYEDFIKSYVCARSAGFDNINADLMFAVPGQTREDYRSTLLSCASLKPEHISAYSLIVEEGTPFYGMKLDLPDEDTEYDMYDDTAEILERYGYRQYEISNYAVPGRESRHNSAYWTGKDYLGFGLAAASLRRGVRYRVTDNMEQYLKNVRSREELLTDRQELTENDRISEFMFLGLRMTDGVSKTEFQNRFGYTVGEIYDTVIRKHKEYGLLCEEDDRIFLTRHGIHVSNQVMMDFLLT